MEDEGRDEADSAWMARKRSRQRGLARDRVPRDELADRLLSLVLRRARQCHAAPTPAVRPAVTRVPNDGSSSARASAPGADESAMTASEPFQVSAASAART